MNKSSDELSNAYAVLLDPEASFFSVQKSVYFIEKVSTTLRTVKLGLSSNVQVDRLSLYLRRHALSSGVRLQVHVGSYDSLSQDIEDFKALGVDVLLFVPFFDNLMPAFESQIAGGLNQEIIDAKASALREQYRIAFEAARSFPGVIVTSFHRAWPSLQCKEVDRVTEVLILFQKMLSGVISETGHVNMLDLSSVVAFIGARQAIDRRFYAQAKAPYSVSMLNEIAQRVAAATRGFGSYYYKVLALDCDNTLWGGVIGEDLVSGIKLSPYEYPGNVFWRAQHEFLGLEKAGVVLCLCTKNNPADIEEVLNTHSDMPIRSKDLTLKKVNWESKSENLRAIAAELNVGLDSIIFLDDSNFELEGVRTQVPSVRTFQVPEALTEYPRVIDEIKSLFLAGGVSAESAAKTQQYKQRAAAETEKARFATQEEYIASLELEVVLSRNLQTSIPRISELTQKSNQFNLTTRRYSPAEILAAMEDPNQAVYSIVVGDKFGSAGLTGVAVVQYEQEAAVIDAFLMSCRVIGRGVEFCVWPDIARDAARRGCSQVIARYIRTPKNSLVQDFYDRLGLGNVASLGDGEKTYAAPVSTLYSQLSPWIRVSYDG